MCFVGSYSQAYYDTFYNRFSKQDTFHRSIAMVFNETTNYDFILSSKTCQRNLETRAANVWDLVRSTNHPFNNKLSLQESNQ